VARVRRAHCRPPAVLAELAVEGPLGIEICLTFCSDKFLHEALRSRARQLSDQRHTVVGPKVVRRGFVGWHLEKKL